MPATLSRAATHFLPRPRVYYVVVGVDVSETLRALRRKRGLTQEQLGVLARIARTDIVAFETGAKPVGAARLQRLADALGVSPVELGSPTPASDDERGMSLLDRQAQLEAEAAEIRRLIGAVLAILKEVGDRVSAVDGGSPPRVPRMSVPP